MRGHGYIICVNNETIYNLFEKFLLDMIGSFLMAHSVLLPNILFFDLYLFCLLTRRAALHRRCWGSVRVWVRVLISAAGAGWAAGLCMVLGCDGPMHCAGDRCVWFISRPALASDAVIPIL